MAQSAGVNDSQNYKKEPLILIVPIHLLYRQTNRTFIWVLALFFFFLVENLFLSDTALIYLDRFLGLLQVASCPNYSLPQLGWRILECPQYIAGQCLMGHS